MNDETCRFHEKISADIETLTNRVNNHADRIDKLEMDGVASKKDIKSIFDLLTKLEKSVEKICDKLEVLNNRPAANIEKFIWILITAITSSAITVLIAFLVKK